LLHLLGIVVHGDDHVVAPTGEGGGGHESDVAGSDDGDLHSAFVS
jgi:hypothetical protein